MVSPTNANSKPANSASSAHLATPTPGNSPGSVRSPPTNSMQPRPATPVPAQLEQQILQGEYIDFATLLDKALLIFLMLRELHPANHFLLFKAWLQYGRQFRTLDAFNPFLSCDQHHPELWYGAMTTVNNTQQDSKYWPCTYCRAKNHLPDNYPCSPFYENLHTLSHLIAEHLKFHYVAILTMDSAQEMHALCHARAPLSHLLSRQETNQPKPVRLDPCHIDCSLLSMTKSTIDHRFYSSILCTQPFKK